ncbi:hypothetical protein QBC41DRAFT_360180 [Cercophora samala]|uniref:Uncharacterized protein n=1 Tax=Cercophora samala TaxID=330535 RepID=A0AA39YX41_9PEZI|nr:hypothetical protein QBC41DRAFT_360180 [Cercophora samala]
MAPGHDKEYPASKGVRHAVPRTDADPTNTTSASSPSTPNPPSPSANTSHLPENVIEISDDDEPSYPPPNNRHPLNNPPPPTHPAPRSLPTRPDPYTRRPSKPIARRAINAFSSPPNDTLPPPPISPPRPSIAARAEQAKKNLVAVCLQDLASDLSGLSSTISTARSTAKDGDHERVDKLLYELSSQASRLRVKLNEVRDVHNRG